MTTPTFVAITSYARLQRGSVLRGARVAALVTVSAILGGCAVWNSIFSDTPAVESAQTAPAAVPEGAGQVPIAPQALPPAMPASAPVVVSPEPAIATPAPVYTPAAPAAEIPPPSPLPKVAEPAAAKAASAAVPIGPGFYINVGLFAVPSNGNNAVGILRAAGLPVFADTVESTKKGTLTRVRVGPYAKKLDAATAAKKIKGLKLDAVVFERK